MNGQMNIYDYLGGAPVQPTPKQLTPKPAKSKETAQTRRESHKKTIKTNKYTEILTVLGSDVMTAREIADALYNAGILAYPARAMIQPRITELTENGVLKVVGKKYDEVTGRNVAQYWRVRT